MYAPLPLSPRRLGTSLRVRGKLTTKEERIYSFYFLYKKTENRHPVF